MIRVLETTEIEFATIKSRSWVAKQQKPVHESGQLVDTPKHLDVDDAQAGEGPPEVAPAPGEHARPHGLPHGQEA